ncbi:phage protein NinX family protein [Geminicoccus flavidas]|uniref:phage protein NinX family protein n=1 Tax=Geminicoccus flavidas TaxID=2506407 RepID=UPI00135910E7|nr:phage protein NinX family protein [Geminicoccus flavidas]
MADRKRVAVGSIKVTVDGEEIGIVRSFSVGDPVKRVAELDGAELDAAVARALGHQVVRRCDLPYQPYIADPANHPTYGVLGMVDPGKTPAWDTWLYIPDYSSDWSDGGPIIERERIGLNMHHGEWGAWATYSAYESNDPDQVGPTPLIAAMRAFVASKFGETVPA